MNLIKKTSQKNIDAVNHFESTTDRLLLRKFRLADVSGNIEHEMNEEIMRYIRDPEPRDHVTTNTMKMVQNWKGHEHEWVLIAIRNRSDNAYVGMVSLRYESIDNDTVELGWRLGTEFHGQGLATEAASSLMDFVKQQLKPHKVTAFCVAENHASSNIMKKLGMKKEAHFSQFSKLYGQWCDETVYGIVLNQ